MRSAAWRSISTDLGELVEARDVSDDALKPFEAYKGDPLRFIDEVLGIDLWSRQKDIVRSFIDHRRTVVRSGNALGKDTTCAALALYAAYCDRSWVLLGAPTKRQIEKVMFGEIEAAFTYATDLPGHLFTNELRLPGTHARGILGFTSNDASRLRGFHSRHGIVGMFTEAQGLAQATFTAMEACATGPDDRIIAVGNPEDVDGVFFRMSLEGSGWNALKISVFEHPNLNPEEGRWIPGGPSKEFAETVERDYGKDSPEYLNMVLGEFAEGSGGGRLIQPDWIALAEDMYATRAFDSYLYEHPYIAALDVSREGRDSSVLAIRKGPVLTNLIEWKGRSDTSMLVVKVVDTLRELKLGPDRLGALVIDATGVGGGVADRIADEHGYNVVDFQGGHRPEEVPRNPLMKRVRPPGHYLNKRAQAYWLLRDLLEDAKIALPKDRALREELLALTYTTDNQMGKVQMVAKKTLRAKLKRSPDRADAVSMAYYVQGARTLNIW